MGAATDHHALPAHRRPDPLGANRPEPEGPSHFGPGPEPARGRERQPERTNLWPRPRARPLLVPHTQLKAKSMTTPEGRAMLVHSIAHIELNAIDLALDVVWRFAGMPEAFYTDWVRIAQEEAKHFSLLRQHLLDLGFDYGDFPAHNTLWDMAERTQGDILARIGIVPRTMEARGLDASPGVKNKLVSVGDHRAGEILDIILEDEIGHVASGNRWYRYLCAERGLDPVRTYAELIAQYDAPKLAPALQHGGAAIGGV
jgi:uncharacterized ferritin-like protein (DUF455 family)